MRNFFSFLFEMIKIVVLSLAIIIPIRYFLVQPFYVKGASMEPNFYDHEYLIINEITYRLKDPARGDIVVFRYPKNPQEYFIKRIIGMPGEKIEIKNGEVRVYNEKNKDGFVLDEDYLEEGTKTYTMGDESTRLGADEYYVLGDNRNSSKDSRVFGPVSESFFVGKVLLRGWPFSRFNFFNEYEYQH